jgi:hypothetical protein
MLQPIFECAICGKPVSLEESKVDAVGKAVHEDCYVSKIKMKIKSGRQIAPPSNPGLERG